VASGGIDAGLDLDALAAIPAALPGASVVLVGPLLVPALRPALEAIPGLVLLGEQPYARLPGLYAAADVCLLPFRLTPFNIARDSLKLYEYLAAGRPVVATATPQALRLAATAGDLHVCSSPAEHARACARAAAGGRRAGRHDSTPHAWAARAQSLRVAAGREATAPRGRRRR
jgi:glycosyltransferase involved in cell wall biosynthesis